METFDENVEIKLLLRAVVATLLGAILGLERELRGSEAGIRTYAAVALGACAFGGISGFADPFSSSHIASGVIVGIGFLGAGMIFKHDDRVNGLTTAATILCTAAMGLAVSFGMYFLGIFTTLLTLGIGLMTPVSGWIKRYKAKKNSGKTDSSQN